MRSLSKSHIDDNFLRLDEGTACTPASRGAGKSPPSRLTLICSLIPTLPTRFHYQQESDNTLATGASVYTLPRRRLCRSNTWHLVVRPKCAFLAFPRGSKTRGRRNDDMPCLGTLGAYFGHVWPRRGRDRGVDAPVVRAQAGPYPSFMCDDRCVALACIGVMKPTYNYVTSCPKLPTWVLACVETTLREV